jgi:hypothetical protein
MSDQDPPATPDQEPPNGPGTDPHGEPTRVDTPVSDPTMAMPAAAAGGPPTAPYTPDEPPPTEPPGTGEPPAEPPDRRPWVIIGLLIVLLLLGFALWMLLQDDDDESTADTSSTTTSSTTSSTTTTAPTTTTTAPTTTTTTAPPTTIDPARCVSSEPDDPDITANVVFDAYAVSDRDCASNLMTSDALDDLFAIPGEGGGWTFMGCDEVADPEAEPTACSYRFEGGSTTFNMQYDDGWVVFEVSQTAD